MRPFLLLLQLFGVYAQNEFVDKSLPDSETHLTDEDFDHAKMEPNNQDGPIDDSGMYNRERFEGDIANADLSSQNIERFVDGPNRRSVMGVMRNAIRQAYQRWPNGRIPYTISTQYTQSSRARIAEAFDEYAKFTCIKFTPKTDQDYDYVHIFPEDGCYSMVGRVGGRQKVSLASGCLQKGIIIHELMHTVGFFHEQSRADRDDYVTIHWENIEDGLSDQFDKYSLRVIDHLGAQYDYSSIMHYGPTAFSKNGLNTIEPKQPGVVIGQRRGFSQTDLYKINRLYNCPREGTETRITKIPTPTTQTTQAPESECEDRLDSCYMLSLLGQCDLGFSSRFMNNNCPRTCGKCTQESCADQRSWCKDWANSGMCDSWFYGDYMHRKCARSCGLC